MAQLAIRRGKPVREKPFLWPIWDKDELNLLREVLESRNWWREGGKVDQAGGMLSKVEQFEREFAKFHEAKYGLAVTNGTHALEVALTALGIGAGDEVIVPAYTFIATATAVLYVNAIPVLVDVNSDDFCINTKKIEEAITDRTKAIIPVHFAGHPANLDEVLEIAQRHNLFVVEDAAQAHGAEWKNKKVGAIGNVGTLSFQASKSITAGEGGIILSNNMELLNRCYSIHNFGRVKDSNQWYSICNLGSNYRLSEFQGAVLLAQLKRFKAQSEQRNRNAIYLSQLLSEIPGIIPQKRDKSVTNQGYYIYCFKYEQEYFNNISRETFKKALNAEGIPTHPEVYPAVHQTPLFKQKKFRVKGCPIDCKHYYGKIDYSTQSFPVAEELAQKMVWLPHYVLLGERKNVEDVAEAINKIRSNCTELS